MVTDERKLSQPGTEWKGVLSAGVFVGIGESLLSMTTGAAAMRRGEGKVCVCVLAFLYFWEGRGVRRLHLEWKGRSGQKA